MRWEPPYGPHTHNSLYVTSLKDQGNLLGRMLAPLGFTDEGTEVERSKPLAWGYTVSERQS